MVDWALSFWVIWRPLFIRNAGPECRSRTQEEVRESVHCDFVFVLSEGIGHSRKD